MPEGTYANQAVAEVTSVIRAVSVPLGSSPSRRAVTRTSAPISPSPSSSPVRVGFTPTPGIVTALPGTRAAATRKKAAEEMSPGTWIA